jgi:hypothetical protein
MPNFSFKNLLRRALLPEPYGPITETMVKKSSFLTLAKNLSNSCLEQSLCSSLMRVNGPDAFNLNLISLISGGSIMAEEIANVVEKNEREGKRGSQVFRPEKKALPTVENLPKHS